MNKDEYYPGAIARVAMGHTLIESITWNHLGHVRQFEIVLVLGFVFDLGGDQWVEIMTSDARVGIFPISFLNDKESSDNGVQEKSTPSMIETRKM
jgi:hypothetical protein